MAEKFGIETKYRGRNHRSRLEAKWSRFFSLIGWPHEYEPFDLPGWIPDFMVGNRMLVEIKPFAILEDWIGEIETIKNAMILGGRTDDVLLLGCYGPHVVDGYLSIGFLGEFSDGGQDFSDSAFGISARTGKFDICHRTGWYGERISGHYPGGSWPETDDAAIAAANSAWANSGNDTQWTPRALCAAR